MSEQIEKRLETIEHKLDAHPSSNPNTNSSNLTSVTHADDEIDLGELLGVIWEGKWFIIAATFLFIFGSIFYAISLPNMYKSDALVAPVEESSGGGLAGLAGQFGGLASLAGVSFGGGGNDKTTLAIEVLKSREFISKFIDKHELLVPLMAAKGWNKNQDELIYDSDVYDVNSRKWVIEPTKQQAYREFVKKFGVSQDKKTNYVRLSFEFFSPTLAKEWVELAIQDINSEIKQRDVTEAKKSVRYLTEQLGKTSVADMKTVFYDLIEEQSKVIMFTEVRDEYVFKTIDRAIVPELKSKPKRSLICIVGALLGGMLGVLFVLVRYFVRSKPLKKMA